MLLKIQRNFFKEIVASYLHVLL